MAENNAAPAAKEVKKVEHKNVYAAQSALQGELKPIKQTAVVDFEKKNTEGKVNFSYAPLDEIMEVLYPLLGKHGLSVRHEFVKIPLGGTLFKDGLDCVLTHETAEEKPVTSTHSVSKEGGEVVTETREQMTRTNEIRSGALPIDLTNSDMKIVGANITYARRYTLGVVLGLSTEKDMDVVLVEEQRRNVSQFAFDQAKSSIKTANAEKLKEHVNFLTKELELAEAMEKGEGTKAPSLGLASAQYKELLEFAKEKQKSNGNG